jgi:predicted protein tyrosine phosphatase
MQTNIHTITLKPTFSDDIRACREGVVRNPYQGTDKKVVFVCSMGILRSATAARIYAHKYNTRTAGTWNDALIPLTPILVAWADELVFVNKENYESFMNRCDDPEMARYLNIKVLNIPDHYEHMHPELVKAFKEQYEDF